MIDRDERQNPSSVEKPLKNPRLEDAPAPPSLGERVGHLLFRSTAAPALIIDPATGAVRDANAAAAPFLGVALPDLVGQPIQRVVTSGHSDVLAALAAVVDRGDGLVEFRCRRADGAERDAQAIASRLVLNDAPLVYAVLHDVSELRQVRAALARSEQLHQAMVEYSSDVVALIGPDGAIQYVSASVERLLDYAPDSLIGRNVFALIHPDDRAVVEAAFVDTLAGPADGTNVEYRVHHRDGGYRVVEAIGTLLAMPGATEPTVFVSMRDVTARAQTQLIATLQSRVIQLAGAGAPLSETTRIITAEAHARITDRRLAVLLLNPSGDTLELVTDEGLPPTVAEALRALPVAEAGDCAIAMRDRVSVATPSLANTGGDRSLAAMRAAGFVACRSLPIIDPETDAVVGSLRMLAATPLRATELGGRLYPALADLVGLVVNRSRSYARLRESEERFRLTVEYAPFGVMITDLQGRIIIVNRAFCALLGYAADELLGRSYRTFLDRTGREEGIVKFPQLLRGEQEAYRVRRKFIAKDGTRIPTEVSIALIRDARGAPLQVVAEVEDLRERLRAEEERLTRERVAQEQQRLESLGLLAGGVAHDFNNLLVSVLGNADLALQELPDHSPTREMIAQVKRAAEHAADLTRQLLASSGKGLIVADRVNVREALLALAEPLRALLPGTVTMMISSPDSLPMVEADPAQFRQIVTNLVENAGEAIGDSVGQVSIVATVGSIAAADRAAHPAIADLPDTTYVTIEVRDTGPGMDAETLARVFDPFFTTKFPGRGLGLAAAQGMARSHGGAVIATSAPGHGAAFRVLLPAVTTADTATPQRLTAPPAKATVLIVDDEEHVRRVVSAMTRQFGYDVIEAVDGQSALAILDATDAVHCVLLDLTMPNGSGADVLAVVRDQRPTLPVVLMSGFHDDDTVRRLVAQNVADFLPKPFTMRELRATLTKAVGA